MMKEVATQKQTPKWMELKKKPLTAEQSELSFFIFHHFHRSVRVAAGGKPCFIASMTPPPSSIAAVTLAFRNLIQAAMPTRVDVSTQPPAQAEEFSRLTGFVARVNVVCYHVSPSPSVRNISLARIDLPGTEASKVSSLNLFYLVTVYGTSSPEEEQSTERLLEAALRAVDQKSLLTSAELESTLPAGAVVRNATARIVSQSLTLAEVESLFAGLHAVHRPSLTYTVTLSEA